MIELELCIVLAIILINIDGLSKIGTCKRVPHGKYCMLTGSHTCKLIPNSDTFEYIGCSSSDIEDVEISDNFIEQYVPSLKILDHTPDEALNVKLWFANEIQPPKFWTKSIFMKGIFNPSICLWYNMTIASWRTGRYNSELRFSTLDLNFERSPSKLFDNLRITSMGLNETQEDARLFVDNNELLMISFSTYNSLAYGRPHQALATAMYNDTILLSPPQIMEIELQPQEHQKNWVAIQGSHQVYYITSFNPMHIIKYEHVNNRRSTSAAANISEVQSKQPSSHSYKVVVKSVHREGEPIALPWRGDIYGEHIRGGTPTLYLSKLALHLALFHTVTKVHGRNVYFMGAMTLCRQFPFKIHSMSQVPIVKESFYNGAWLNKYVAYAVFPGGILLDPNNSSLIWVAVGHQDSDGWCLQMEVDGLLQSLELVHDCEEKDNTTSQSSSITPGAKSDVTSNTINW